MSTPYDANSQLKKYRGEPITQTQYAQINGSLLYLMNFSRPDITYAVGRLSRYTIVLIRTIGMHFLDS